MLLAWFADLYELYRLYYRLAFTMKIHEIRYTTDVEGNSLGVHHGDYFTYGAGISEIELDVLTGEIRPLRSDILYDVGQSINPGIDLGQLEGAFVYGIGYYLYEEPLRDARGVERSQGVWAYKPPMAPEVPIEPPGAGNQHPRPYLAWSTGS